MRANVPVWGRRPPSFRVLLSPTREHQSRLLDARIRRPAVVTDVLALFVVAD